MTIWPDDFEVQDLATIPIKKEEAKHQAALVAALRKHWSLIKDETLQPMVIHIPMGGSRDQKEACNLRTAGATAGTPDLTIIMPDGKIIWVEMKAESGVISGSQLVFHRRLVLLGHTVLVAYSVFDALDQLRKAVF